MGILTCCELHYSSSSSHARAPIHNPFTQSFRALHCHELHLLSSLAYYESLIAIRAGTSFPLKAKSLHSLSCVNLFGMQICPGSRWVRVSEKVRGKEPWEVALCHTDEVGWSHCVSHWTHLAVKPWPQPGPKASEVLEFLTYHTVPATVKTDWEY